MWHIVDYHKRINIFLILGYTDVYSGGEQGPICSKNKDIQNMSVNIFYCDKKVCKLTV